LTVPLAIESPTTTNKIGRTTESRTLIGVYWGYLSMMEGLIGRMKSEIGKSLTVIATGSLAALVQGHSILNGDSLRSANA
jgi:type III pantothenate kinase